LGYFAGAATDGIVFVFALVPQGDDRPETIIFHVGQVEVGLVWPVRVALGADANAQSFEIGATPNSPRSLSGADAEQLLRHLKSGGDLHITYSMNNGTRRHAVLGQYGFSQSVAMFDACVAMSPNNRLQRTGEE
jgi:hypothetical protein